MIEHLNIDGFLMGVGGQFPDDSGDTQTYHAIREQLYANMMGWA